MAEKPYRAVQKGVSVWSTPPSAPLTSQSLELFRVISGESKMADERRSAESQFKRHGRTNMKAENFSAVLREDTPAYPVYLRRRRKTLDEMTVEELFEIASNFRPSKRSHSDIARSGAYCLDNEIIHRPGMDREKEKDRLSNIMAYGPDADCAPITVQFPNHSATQPTPPPKDEFEELLDEIDERQTFLEQMVKIGCGQQYRQLIALEVVELLNKLNQSDKARYDALLKNVEGSFHKPIVNNIY